MARKWIVPRVPRVNDETCSSKAHCLAGQFLRANLTPRTILMRMTFTPLQDRDDCSLPNHDSPICRFRSLTLPNNLNVLRACSPYRTPQSARPPHSLCIQVDAFLLLTRCLSVRWSGVPKVTKLSKGAAHLFAAVLRENHPGFSFASILWQL